MVLDIISYFLTEYNEVRQTPGKIAQQFSSAVIFLSMIWMTGRFFTKRTLLLCDNSVPQTDTDVYVILWPIHFQLFCD